MISGGIGWRRRYGVSRRRGRTTGPPPGRGPLRPLQVHVSATGARRMSLGPGADPRLGHLRQVHASPLTHPQPARIEEPGHEGSGPAARWAISRAGVLCARTRRRRLCCSRPQHRVPRRPLTCSAPCIHAKRRRTTQNAPCALRHRLRRALVAFLARPWTAPDQLFVALSRERQRGDLLLERVRLLPYA
jgi:hypothetical protein